MSNGGALNVAVVGRTKYNIHPTALISSCDFLARLKAEEKLGIGAKVELVVGLVTGHLHKDSRATTELLNCVEVKYTLKPEFKFDKEFVQNKHKMLKKVDPEGTILGWFCFGNKLPVNYQAIHQQFLTATNGIHGDHGGIAVVFDRIDVNSVNELPVSVFSFQKGKKIPTSIEVALALDPAEEIAMSAISKLEPPNESGESQLLRQYRVMKTSLQKLKGRVSIIQEYLRAVQKGTVQPDHVLLRKIRGITAQLPMALPDASRLTMLEQQSEAMLFSYLTKVVESAGTMQDIIQDSSKAMRGFDNSFERSFTHGVTAGRKMGGGQSRGRQAY